MEVGTNVSLPEGQPVFRKVKVIEHCLNSTRTEEPAAGSGARCPGRGESRRAISRTVLSSQLCCPSHCSLMINRGITWAARRPRRGTERHLLAAVRTAGALHPGPRAASAGPRATRPRGRWQPPQEAVCGGGWSSRQDVRGRGRRRTPPRWAAATRGVPCAFVPSVPAPPQTPGRSPARRPQRGRHAQKINKYSGKLTGIHAVKKMKPEMGREPSRP